MVTAWPKSQVKIDVEGATGERKTRRRRRYEDEKISKEEE